MPWILGGIGIALVLALVLTVLAVVQVAGGHSAPSAGGRAPFDAAIKDLSQAPGMRYRTRVGLTSVEMQVTATSEAYGTMHEGGLDVDVMRVDGKSYFRSNSGQLPSNIPNAARTGTAIKGRWVRSDGSWVGELDRACPTPQEFAEALAAALNDVRTFPTSSTESVDGVPALRVRTSVGTLFVTRDEPHRLLRFDPLPGSGFGAEDPAPGSAGAGRTRSTWFAALDAPATVVVFASLHRETAALTRALDLRSISASVKTDVKCQTSDCPISAKVTLGASPDPLASRTARIEVQASLTVEGLAAGTCTTSGTAAYNSTTTLSCTPPGSGAVVQRAADRARSAAVASGATRWQVLCNALASVLVLADVDVTQVDAGLTRHQQQVTPGTAPSTASAST